MEKPILIPYDSLIEEIDKEITFYENSSHVNDFEKWSDSGAVGALNSLKDNIYKLRIL
jgi:Tfp pilus assembly PilM family ATPase